jgi:hypothetical protein
MAQNTERAYAAEWLKWTVNPAFCLVTDTITANAGATAGLVSGQTMEGGAGAKAENDGGPCTAVLVEPVSLAEHIAGCKKLMLVRGPAIIDSDKMGVDDPSDLTDLQGLNIFAINSALLTWSTQST